MSSKKNHISLIPLRANRDIKSRNNDRFARTASTEICFQQSHPPDFQHRGKQSVISQKLKRQCHWFFAAFRSNLFRNHYLEHTQNATLGATGDSRARDRVSYISSSLLREIHRHRPALGWLVTKSCREKTSGTQGNRMRVLQKYLWEEGIIWIIFVGEISQ